MGFRWLVPVDKCDLQTILPLVKKYVAAESCIVTDACKAHDKLCQMIHAVDGE